MSKLSDVLSGARVPQQRVEQAHSQPAVARPSGISIPGVPTKGIAIPGMTQPTQQATAGDANLGAIPSGNQQAAGQLTIPSTGNVAIASGLLAGQAQQATVASAPARTPIVPVRAAAPNDMLAALANTEVQLTNDVADWPELAYANIDTNDVKGQMQVLLLDLQQNMQTNDIGQHLRRIMGFIGANPAMADTLLPDEFGLIVDALKSSHGVVISTKTENRVKKQSKAKATNELLDAFKDIEF